MVEAVVRTNQLFESSQVQVKPMTPKRQCSVKKFDIVKDGNRVEHVRGSSSEKIDLQQEVLTWTAGIWRVCRQCKLVEILYPGFATKVPPFCSGQYGT
ncbi:hypothetical protein GNI_057770 [Gregarina niphandrodes]|uniref:Uncharacterized protein n=1 Tax=Gregarina niphandrodes TaxID=110365 RepID=A0A023B8M4_GRENI|nr:hypothetical protein GNI_057770 [Gregarina niphandrodes]EZG69535.1 hypothetical protein GNI_057770 [Gregarina niphandrodes]|eukprot:XP_011130008.1 hypothetical protein GNI_057770 [Gregarina niphandrodes]